MLIGNYHHSLQEKGRLAIPSAFRKQLGEKPIITKGIEPHLILLPLNIWSNLIKDLGNHPFVSSQDRQLRRLVAHQAQQVDFDRQGRILIPSQLIAWASLKKTVVVAGSIDWVEIWDLEIYQDYQANLEDHSQEIAAKLEMSNT